MKYDPFIRWASPANALYFIPLFLLITLTVFTFFRIKKVCSLLVHKKHSARLLLHFSLSKQYIKLVCMVLALLFLGIALMQPQWGMSDEKSFHQGRDLLVALDISRSMLAQDYTPNRLEYAKEKIKKLAARLSAERVGLLVFSGDAIMQCPLTSDHQAFFMFLDTISVETVSSGTTSYSAALQKILESSPSFGSDHTTLVVLCTDGEDFSPNISALEAKLMGAGIHVCTLGVATHDGAPIPLYDEQGVQRGFQKDEKGEIVISRRNEAIMKNLAQATQGLYVPVTLDDGDITHIQSWVQGFEKTQWEERDQQRLQDRYYYFTGAAWLALLFEWIL